MQSLIINKIQVDNAFHFYNLILSTTYNLVLIMKI